MSISDESLVFYVGEGSGSEVGKGRGCLTNTGGWREGGMLDKVYLMDEKSIPSASTVGIRGTNNFAEKTNALAS